MKVLNCKNDLGAVELRAMKEYKIFISLHLLIEVANPREMKEQLSSWAVLKDEV